MHEHDVRAKARQRVLDVCRQLTLLLLVSLATRDGFHLYSQ